MKSRERVLTALAHQEPDRVPIDFGGGAATGLSAVAHDRLMKHMGLEGLTKVWHQYLQWPVIDPRILELFEVDCINVVPMPAEWKKDLLPDGSPGLVPTAWRPRTCSTEFPPAADLTFMKVMSSANCLPEDTGTIRSISRWPRPPKRILTAFHGCRRFRSTWCRM